MSINDELQTFIRQNFRNVWAVEILLLLRRSRPRAWSVEELVKELRANEALVRSNLEAFERGGMVSGDPEGRYGFAPAARPIEEICGALDNAYRERPVSVINLIAAPEDLGGVFAMGYAVVGTFFFRFWRRTRDGLFAAFSVAFAFLAFSQAWTGLLGATRENQTSVYLLRLAAFALILGAIVYKNLFKPGR